MGRLNLLVGQINLLSGQMPTQLTCYLPCLPPCNTTNWTLVGILIDIFLYFFHIFVASKCLRVRLPVGLVVYPETKIVHGYSHISIPVSTQIIPCSCKIHANYCPIIIKNSCPLTLNGLTFNPKTMAYVHEIWVMHKIFGINTFVMPSSWMFMSMNIHEVGINYAWLWTSKVWNMSQNSQISCVSVRENQNHKICVSFSWSPFYVCVGRCVEGMSE